MFFKQGLYVSHETYKSCIFLGQFVGICFIIHMEKRMVFTSFLFNAVI